MKRASRFSAVLAVLVLAAPSLGLLAVGAPAQAAVTGSYNLDQCANGGRGSTATSCVEGRINGNLGTRTAQCRPPP